MANKETLDALEATMDTIEATLDKIESVPAAVTTVVKHNPWVLTGVAVASAAVGAGVALYFGNRHYKALYERIANDEIAEAHDLYKKKFKDGEYADPVKMAASLDEVDEEETDEADVLVTINNPPATTVEDIKASIDIVSKQGYVSYDKVSKPAEREVVEVTTSIKSNIFDAHGDKEFNLDDELDKKSAGEPYIVEVDQYSDNVDGYSQTSLIFYEGDGTLAEEESGRIVDDIMGTVGGEGNLKFGCGSEDPNIVYIFNDRFGGGAGFEVIRERGSYSKLVLGLDEDELQHSDGPRIRRMRPED